MTDDIIHDAEQLRRYISLERWNAWILRMRWIYTSNISQQLITEANINKMDLAVVWLNLAKTYGTILHTLVEVLPKHNYIPGRRLVNLT